MPAAVSDDEEIGVYGIHYLMSKHADEVLPGFYSFSSVQAEYCKRE